MKTSFLTILSLYFLLAITWFSAPIESRRRRRCKVVAPWRIGNGNPIMGNEGFTTIMYILSKSAHSNAYQMRALNEYGKHFEEVTKERVRIIALNPIGYPPITEDFENRYPFVRIYQEPDDGQKIFRRLGGYERDMLIYDECSRLNFQYGFPYSFMGFPWISRAIKRVMYHHADICGACKGQAGYLASRTLVRYSTSNNAPAVRNNQRVKQRRKRL